MSASPADLRPRRNWSLWRQVLAYVVLAALASLSIWFVDRDATRPNTDGAAAAPQR